MGGDMPDEVDDPQGLILKHELGEIFLGGIKLVKNPDDDDRVGISIQEVPLLVVLQTDSLPIVPSA